MSFFKKALSGIVGTAEPEYGPSAIQTVTAQAQTTPYTELATKDLHWKTMNSTSVETQTFYITGEDGTTSMAQLLYSNVAGMKTTCQFNSKIFDHDGEGKHLFCTDPVSHYKVDKAKTGMTADECSVILNEDGNSYAIKSHSNADNIVDIVVTRAAPGFVCGTDGTSYFGTDPKKPWGSMRHAFWPRCNVTGTMQTKKKTYDLKGRGIYIQALQGMKPHHAAARWNFINYQSAKYSAVVMEFTTPVSYGSTVVNVGGVAKDGELLYAGVTNSVKHTASEKDPVIGWPQPTAMHVEWKGKNKAGQVFDAQMEGSLKGADRVDVLAHIPTVIKNIIGGVVGTKPIIYQYNRKEDITLKVKEGENEVSDAGHLYCEATFIS